MKFRRLYVEEYVIDRVGYPISDLVNESVINKEPVIIGHYKDIFSRSNQDLDLQRQYPSLILAAKRPPVLFTASRQCSARGCSDGDHGHHRGQYYALPMMNCPMECEYCFLRGMYPTANIVYFVNFKEVFPLLKQALYEKGVSTLAISYESDILALDRILHCLEPWLEFARGVPGTLFEVRTKAGSGMLQGIENISLVDNVVLAWTISPREVIDSFEKRTPSLDARIQAIRWAMEKGWRVRLCIDPILFIESWEDLYGKAISEVFAMIDPGKVEEVHLGVFRMGKCHLKRARKRYPGSQLLHYPYVPRGDSFTYPMETAEMLTGKVEEILMDYLPHRKIRLMGEW